MSLIAGFILLVAVSFAIPHAFPVTINGIEYTGYADIAVDLVPWATIFIFAAGKAVGLLLILVVIVAQFFCGMSSITANSRMVYAFSRDGAVPFSNFWHHVSKGARVPVRTAWFGAVGAFILALPYLYNFAAYARRDVHRRHRPLHRLPDAGVPAAHQPERVRARALGAEQDVGPVIGWIAIVWVVFICIVLMLPQYNTACRGARLTDSFNYAPSRCSSSSASPASGTPSRPASGSRARRSRVPPKSSPRSSATSTHLSRVTASKRSPTGRASRPAPFLLRPSVRRLPPRPREAARTSRSPLQARARPCPDDPSARLLDSRERVHYDAH